MLNFLKLEEYRSGNLKIDVHDQIFLQKFEELFMYLHNGKNVIYANLGFGTNFKARIASCLEMLKQHSGKKVFLSSNPDVDIPCPRDEFFLQDDMPYTEEFQRHLESSKLEDLVDLDLLKYFDSDIQSFCHAVTKDAPGLHMIPIGRDWKGLNNLLTQNYDLSGERGNLCYYNCSMPPKSVHWYGRIREHIAVDCQRKDFIKTANLKVVTNRNLDYDSFTRYYSDIINSDFMICPRGCGADTYRMWDCLYLGCIPIVVKYDGYKELEDLPIFFIESWKNYLQLTKEDLLVVKNEMMQKTFNYSKLQFSWWKDRISKEAESVLSSGTN